MSNMSKRLIGVLLTAFLGVGMLAVFLPSVPAKAAGVIPMIATGNFYSLALKSDGTVWTWGQNNHGQLGNGTTTNSSTPVQVKGVDGSDNLTDIIAVAAGLFHSLALRSDGTVWAWGYNNYGQLGIGTTADSLTPVQVSTLSNITAISTTYNHSIALKSDGTVWAWGYNNYGQLGNDSTTNSSTPVQVKGVGGIGNLTNITAIVAGGSHSLALKNDGIVYAWGYNGDGELGNNSTTDSSTPVQVSSLTNISSISGKGSHSLALKSDGTVWAWGWNDYGQLGDGTTTQRNIPVQVKGVGGIGNLTNITAIAAGNSHSLALKSDDTVYAWGSNSRGQLGDGTTTQRNTPVQVSSLTNISSISAGNGHSLALKSDGTVWAWGQNIYGQLGDGTTTDRNAPVLVSISLPIPVIVTQTATVLTTVTNTSTVTSVSPPTIIKTTTATTTITESAGEKTVTVTNTITENDGDSSGFNINWGIFALAVAFGLSLRVLIIKTIKKKS
ncbi:MAG: hypothetical protein FWH42_02425 [Dehalococcoidia bacterium]|nr:hypothetical protein [Dehalococcoidia bacterium]